jgi:hypothetical protein
VTESGKRSRRAVPLAVWIGLAAAGSACLARSEPAPPATVPAPGAWTWSADTRRFALVIGHNRGAATRLPLRFAETDAQRTALVLRQLGNFAHQNVHLLRAPTTTDLQLAFGRVQAQIQAWRRERPAGSGPGRALLLVYFSGHSDGKALELASERLEHGQLLDWIAGAGGDIRVVIVDACRSGSLLAVKGGAPGRDFDLGLAEENTGQAILASAGADEEALESAELGGSYFSHHLLSGLRGAADANRDGRITLSEAYAHAAGRTAAETAATVFGRQRPTYQIHLTGRGDLVLTALPERGTLIELPADLDRALVIDAVRGDVAAEWAPGGARRLAVPPVPLLLRAWRQGRPLSLRLSVEPGLVRQVRAEELVAEPAAPGPHPATAPPGGPPVAAPSEQQGLPGEPEIRQALAPDATCRLRCLLDTRGQRGVCPSPISVLSYAAPDAAAPQRYALAMDLPSRRSLVRLRFEACDPSGLWLHVADSPTSDGAAGDGGQFSNDAELELRDTGLWLWGNDYGRKADLADLDLTSLPDFTDARGCSRGTLLLGDGLVRSGDGRVRVRSPHALRADPPADHEGRPDRRWYLGINRSVGSDSPERVGTGLAWLEICVR